MIFTYPIGPLILLLLLLGFLLGWLLYWLVDSALRRRDEVVVTYEASRYRDTDDCERGCDEHDAHACAPCEDGEQTHFHFTVGDCASKHFVIKPDQRANEMDNSAVDMPPVRPCFEVRWGDSEQDLIKTKDVETLCICARNPYTNVTFKDVTIRRARVTFADGRPIPTVPDGTPSVALTPNEMIRMGSLEAAQAAGGEAAAQTCCEITLTSKQAQGGDYLLHLWCDFRVKYIVHQTDQFTLSIGC